MLLFGGDKREIKPVLYPAECTLRKNTTSLTQFVYSLLLSKIGKAPVYEQSQNDKCRMSVGHHSNALNTV